MSDEQNIKTHEGACEGKCEGRCGGGHFRGKAGAGFLLLAVSGSLLLLAMFFTAVKEYGYIGRDINSQTTISVSGDGDAFRAPDIATISYTITQEAKTAAEASKVVDEKMKKIHAFLIESGIQEKDIKAQYSLYPKTEWQQKQIACISYPCPQPPGKEVLIGYVVSESVDVKIRDIDTNADLAGKIVGGVVDLGATNISGPNFSVEDADQVQAEARKAAIDKAQKKAEELAKQLNVRLVRIVSFNEGGDYPIYNYGIGGAMKEMSMDRAPAPAANIPSGENRYVSNVTITYEIR